MNARLNHSELPLPLHLALGVATAAAMLAALWILMATGPGGAISADGMRIRPETVISMSWTILIARLTATLVVLVGLAAMLLVLADGRR